jgi:apolipoprotein N-acyltransferase
MANAANPGKIINILGHFPTLTVKLLKPLVPSLKDRPTQWSWRWVGLLIASGLLLDLALPPFSLWPLAWVALVPLWLALLKHRAAPWWVAAGYGLVWGITYYGSSLVWITHLHPLMWMGVPWLGSVAIALFAWGFITLWGTVSLMAWCVAFRWVMRWCPQSIAVRLLLGTGLWCLMETLRNYTPLDWSHLSLTQSPNNLWILHLSRLSGPMAITAVLVAANGLLAEAWWQRRHPPEAPFLNRSLAAGALGLIMVSHALGAGLFFQPAPDRETAAITLGMVQGNIPTREKLTWEGINQAIEAYTEGYQALAAEGVDAVVTPEGAIPLMWDPDGARVMPLIESVQQIGVPLWLGTFAPLGDGGGYAYTQSLLEIQQDGLPHGRYNKIQLVPLGEYIPLDPVLGTIINRLSPLDSYMVPGDLDQTFTTSVGTGIVGICYESVYSRLFRHQARNGGEFIITASNNDPYPPWMMQQHHALDVQRAVELNRWAIRVTNTGVSGLVDSHGRTQWLLPTQDYRLAVGTLYRHDQLSAYGAWGDWLTPILLGAGLLAGLRHRRSG